MWPIPLTEWFLKNSTASSNEYSGTLFLKNLPMHKCKYFSGVKIILIVKLKLYVPENMN